MPGILTMILPKESIGWKKSNILAWDTKRMKMCGQNPRGLWPLRFWPWDFPRDSIHHDTHSAFTQIVPLHYGTQRIKILRLSLNHKSQGFENGGEPQIWGKVYKSKASVPHFLLRHLPSSPISNFSCSLFSTCSLFLSMGELDSSCSQSRAPTAYLSMPF